MTNCLEKACFFNFSDCAVSTMIGVAKSFEFSGVATMLETVIFLRSSKLQISTDFLEISGKI